MDQKIGSYAFIIGVAVAILAGLAQGVDSMMATSIMAGTAGIVALVLVLLGLVVGFLNIKDKHITDFLIATIAVAMVGLVALNPVAGLNVTDPIVVVINSIVRNVVTLVAPAALVVGLKQIVVLAREQVM